MTLGKTLMLPLVMGAMAFGLVACGKGEKTEAPAEAPAATAPAPAAEAPAAPAPDAAAPAAETPAPAEAPKP
jgi:hypothetical protein